MRRFLSSLLILFFISFAWIVSCSSARAEMTDHPIVKLQALDKSTARTITFEVKVGSTIEYGSLFIKAQACRKADPLDKPESAAFVQVWEVPLNSKKSEWVFSGWMFASSPALSAMDHAVYDVWVLGCLDKSDKAQNSALNSDISKTANQGELDRVNTQKTTNKATEGQVSGSNQVE